MSEPKVIMKATAHDKATMIAVLLTLRLWDAMSIAEREAAVERGEIWDTPAGRAFMNAADQYGATLV